MPDSGAGLAEQARDIFDGLMVELKEIVANVTDEEASHNPAEEEWNVKQTLAHLILSDSAHLDLGWGRRFYFDPLWDREDNRM